MSFLSAKSYINNKLTENVMSHRVQFAKYIIESNALRYGALDLKM